MTVIKRVLITGDVGYVGSVMAPFLLDAGYQVVGLDTGYFAECSLVPALGVRYARIIRDIREVTSTDIEGIDAVIHLAGLSNDPLGELEPRLTDEINLEATVRLARLARASGVRRFLYASSQSMYGISSSDSELDEDASEKNPITSYARTKWEAELKLRELNSEYFAVTCFRPSTIFGASPRLRCDIVFNNLVACAYTTGRIEIKSDGTPWRPVVHVRDVCSAFLAGLKAPVSIVGGRSYNVGIPDGNFTVRELAEAAQRAVPGSSLVFTGEHGTDSRTYRVSFQRILVELAGYYRPEWTLDRGGQELVAFFRSTGFDEQQFRGSKTIRLVKLKELIATGQLDNSLRWRSEE
jgi:nucleoside-diphosphate-sugar epimerase